MLIRSMCVAGCILGFMQVSLAQSAHKKLREGDLLYDQGEFLAAEEAYRKAGAKDEEAKADYNLGNAIYQQERYDEAVKYYEAAAEAAKDPAEKANAYYNLGNTHFKAQALDKSIDAYKNALKLEPDDLDTKKNLTMALQKLRQQQQQQQQQQPQQQQNKDQQQQQPQPQEDQQKQNPQQQNAQSQQEAQPKESNEDLTKEEAEELLRIIDNEDSKVQEKLRKSTANPKKPVKDW